MRESKGGVGGKIVYKNQFCMNVILSLNLSRVEVHLHENSPNTMGDVHSYLQFIGTPMDRGSLSVSR